MILCDFCKMLVGDPCATRAEAEGGRCLYFLRSTYNTLIEQTRDDPLFRNEYIDHENEG